MAVDAPKTLAIARNSRRSILPVLALSASDSITAGTRSLLLLKMLMASSRVLAFYPTIPHLFAVVKERGFGASQATAREGRPNRTGRRLPGGTGTISLGTHSTVITRATLLPVLPRNQPV